MAFVLEIGDIVEFRRGIDELSLEWAIPNFLSLFSGGCDHYTSPQFNAYDGVWELEIQRKGPRKSDFACLFLCRWDSGPPKTLHVTLGIKGAIEAKTQKGRVQEFSEDDYACCWRGLFLGSEWTGRDSGLVRGTTLSVICVMKNLVPSVKLDSSTQTVEKAKEARHPTEKIQSSEKQETKELKEALQRLLASEEDSDCLIKVQSKQFPVHRNILRTRSPVFHAMFAHDMVEKQSGVVTMEDCDQEMFPDFLEHIYTGSIDMISNKNAFSLYAASEKYDLKSLKKACSEFMKNNLTVASFCSTVTLAVKYNEKELIEVATEFYCNNTLSIVKTAEWQVFLAENPTVGNELYIKQLTK